VSHLITKILSAIAPIYDPVIDLFLGGELKVRRRFAERVAPFEKGLDIGCGTGTFLDMLRKEQPEAKLFGLDVSERMLERAKKKHPEIRFVKGSATDIPFPDGSFDAVFSTMMMHHLDETEKEKAVAEIKRVLVPGGIYYSLEFGETGLTITGRAVTGLGVLEDGHLAGFEMLEKEAWEMGLVWRKAKALNDTGIGES